MILEYDIDGIIEVVNGMEFDIGGAIERNAASVALSISASSVIGPTMLAGTPLHKIAFIRPET